MWSLGAQRSGPSFHDPFLTGGIELLSKIKQLPRTNTYHSHNEPVSNPYNLPHIAMNTTIPMPRTDALEETPLFKARPQDPACAEALLHARQLERELAEARADAERLAESVRECVGECDRMTQDGIRSRAHKALAAHEALAKQ